MLKQRLLTAAILLPLVLIIIFIPATPVFALLAGIAFLAAHHEWTTRLCPAGDVVLRWLMPLLLIALMATLWWQRHVDWLWPVTVLVGIAWWIASLVWCRHFRFAADSTRANGNFKHLIGLLVLLPAWTGLLYLHSRPQHGDGWVLLSLCIVWASDTGAYFAGRAFGKRKLAPHISPAKTRAGAWGALVAGLIVAVIGACILGMRGTQLAGFALLGLVTVAASIDGDLIESLLKRHAGIKDSGSIFPGHGGLLDRLDSTFAAVPVFSAGLMLMGN